MENLLVCHVFYIFNKMSYIFFLHNNFLILFFSLFRIDDLCYKFSTYNICNRLLLLNHDQLETPNVEHTYRILCAGGNRIVTRVRKQIMYQYGGTIGPSRYPRFYDRNLSKISMLPRPVVKSRPGNIGHCLMQNCLWLKKVVKHVEFLTLKHLISDKSEMSLIIREHVHQCKKIIPPCLRICDTFFTQIILVGNFDDPVGDIPLHLDPEDHITALLSIGSPTVKGGSTLYYEKHLDRYLR